MDEPAEEDNPEETGEEELEDGSEETALDELTEAGDEEAADRSDDIAGGAGSGGVAHGLGEIKHG